MLCVHGQGFVNAQGRGVVDLSGQVIVPSDLLTSKLAVEHVVSNLTCFSSFSNGGKVLASCTLFCDMGRQAHCEMRIAPWAAMQPMGEGAGSRVDKLQDGCANLTATVGQCMFTYTSSTTQGCGGKVSIYEANSISGVVGCCDSWMAE